MKHLFRVVVAVLLILCLSASVFAWTVDNNPLLWNEQEISVNTPVEVAPSETNTRCFSFRLTQAGFVRIEIDQPLPDGAYLCLYIGDHDYQHLLYKAALSGGEFFLSPHIGLAANENGYFPDYYYIVIGNIADAAECTLTVNYLQTDEWEIEPNDTWTGGETHALDRTYYGAIYNEEDVDFFHFEFKKRSRVYVTVTSFDGKPVEQFWTLSFSSLDIMNQIENPVVIRHSESEVTYDLGVIWATRLHVQLNALWHEDDTVSYHSGVYSVKVHAEPTDVFPDVAEDAFYADAVKWAIEAFITDGTSRYAFSPEAFCTRGQIVTFLDRMPHELPYPEEYEAFTDVSWDAFYFHPVYWAYENGISNGTSATTFSPEAYCTRAQAVTFLWRFAGCPKAENAEKQFDDVKETDYYYDAVAWAVENGITLGTSEHTFSPDAACTRAQIVTFLYRYATELGA